jgi:malate dehydrogenase (oxaloacetate-decarboxylating)
VLTQRNQAEAISEYSHLFRRAEGLYLTASHIDTMEVDYLEQTKGKDIDLVVCSDGEAILGIGDQGVGVSLDSTARDLILTICLGYWG